MIALHRATGLFAPLLLSLLLPSGAIAADQVAPVSETLRRAQDQAAAPESEAAPPVHQVQASAAAATTDATYVPKTAYDNSPYRFNAGARFTAAEFDAWMKSRGIRVAKGKPATASVEPAANAAEDAACDANTVSAC